MFLKLLDRVTTAIKNFCEERIGYHWYAFAFLYARDDAPGKYGVWYMWVNREIQPEAKDVELCRQAGGFRPEDKYIGCWYLGQMQKCEFDYRLDHVN